MHGLCVFWPLRPVSISCFYACFFFFPSVALSLEAKLQMLHTYMTVTWLPLPCEVKTKVHTIHPDSFLQAEEGKKFHFVFYFCFCPHLLCSSRTLIMRRLVTYIMAYHTHWYIASHFSSFFGTILTVSLRLRACNNYIHEGSNV